MSGSVFGTIFQISTWGESHGKGVGVTVDGCPAGIPLSETEIQQWLDRRKPGQSKFTTQRKESDQAEILSGVFEGKTTGTPIAIMVKNADQRSGDYTEIASYYRPGHADYTFDQKYGFRDYRGGGRSSGKAESWQFKPGSQGTEKRPGQCGSRRCSGKFYDGAGKPYLRGSADAAASGAAGIIFRIGNLLFRGGSPHGS